MDARLRGQPQAGQPADWELSTTLDTGFCLDAVRQALQIYKPKIFNTDQGSQFASTDFTGLLEKHDIKVSMDGRGRVFEFYNEKRLHEARDYRTPSTVYFGTSASMMPTAAVMA